METIKNQLKSKYEQLDTLDTQIQILAELFAEIEQNTTMSNTTRMELLEFILNKETIIHKQYEELLYNDTI